MTQPKYQVIEQTLRARITDGTYPEGSIIPKEVDLAAEFAVSRPTVRQAIRILVNQGLLERKQHRGTLVRQSKIAQQFTHVIQSYNQEIAANGRCSRTDVLGLYTQLATPEVQQALHLPDDAQVYRLVRLRFADDEPVVLVTSYLPVTPLPGLDQVDFARQSLYTELEHRHLGITSVNRKLEVVAADPDTAASLQVAPGSPTFYFHTLGQVSDGRVLEYSIAQYRGDNNYFTFDIART